MLSVQEEVALEMSRMYRMVERRVAARQQGEAWSNLHVTHIPTVPHRESFGDRANPTLPRVYVDRTAPTFGKRVTR